MFFFFFFIDTSTTEIYTLSLHDALPICEFNSCSGHALSAERFTVRIFGADIAKIKSAKIVGAAEEETIVNRSEEHTSELQSHSDLVCRLLLEKKKKKKKKQLIAINEIVQ